jgi:hypothetical protein
MTNTGPLDKIESDKWNADAHRRARHWLIWTLLLLVVAYFLPLRWAVLLALFYARLADPDLKLGDLPFAIPVPFLFRARRRNTVYATSVVLKDESSGDTRARLHILDSGEAALSLYGKGGDETAVFTPKSGMLAVNESEELVNETNGLEGKLAKPQARDWELEEIMEAVREVQSRVGKLESETGERSERASSRCFELEDEEGRVRARLGSSSEGQPRLVFYDRDGVSRASISLGGNSYPELFLTNLHEDFLSPGSGGKTRGRVVLGFDDEGYPQLLMYDDPDPKIGGLDPSVSLKIWKAEHSKGAGLSLRVFGQHDEKFEFFGARVVEPVSGEGA